MNEPDVDDAILRSLGLQAADAHPHVTEDDALAWTHLMESLERIGRSISGMTDDEDAAAYLNMAGIHEASMMHRVIAAHPPHPPAAKAGLVARLLSKLKLCKRSQNLPDRLFGSQASRQPRQSSRRASTACEWSLERSHATARQSSAPDLVQAKD